MFPLQHLLLYFPTSHSHHDHPITKIDLHSQHHQHQYHYGLPCYVSIHTSKFILLNHILQLTFQTVSKPYSSLLGPSSSPSSLPGIALKRSKQSPPLFQFSQSLLPSPNPSPSSSSPPLSPSFQLSLTSHPKTSSPQPPHACKLPTMSSSPVSTSPGDPLDLPKPTAYYALRSPL